MFSFERVGMLYGENGGYTFTSRVSLLANLYMTREDQVFVVDVVVIDLTWEVMAQVSLVNHHV